MYDLTVQNFEDLRNDPTLSIQYKLHIFSPFFLLNIALTITTCFGSLVKSDDQHIGVTEV